MAFGTNRNTGDWFSNFWYSTLGMPEQFIRRMIRTWQDPQVGIFDKRGVFDSYLIPLFGMGLDHSRDVRDKEHVSRLKKSSVGKFLGMKNMPNNIYTQIAASILTDPLTFMTRGATLPFRAALGAQKLRTLPIFNKAVGDAWSSMTVSAARAQITKLQKTARGKEARRLREADKLLAGAPNQGALLGELSEIERKWRVTFGVPTFKNKGAVGWKLDEKHQNWLQVLGGAGSRGFRWAAPIGDVAAGIPIFGHILKGAGDTLFGMKEGFQAGGRGHYAVDTSTAAAAGESGDAVRDASLILREDRIDLRRHIRKQGTDLRAGEDEIVANFNRAERGGDIEKRIAEIDADFVHQGELEKINLPEIQNAPWDKVKDVARLLGIKIKGGRKAVLDQIITNLPGEKIGKVGKKGLELERKALRKELKGLVKHTPHERLLFAMGYKIPVDKEVSEALAESVWQKLTDKHIHAGPPAPAGPLPQTIDELAEALTTYTTRMDDAFQTYGAHKMVMGETTTRKQFDKVAGKGKIAQVSYNIFKGLEDRRVKYFVNDMGRKDFTEPFKVFNNLKARADEAIQLRMSSIEEGMGEAAREVGLEREGKEGFEGLVMTILESASAPGEAAALTRLGAGDPFKFYNSITSFASRQFSYLNQLGLIAKASAGSAHGMTGDAAMAIERLVDPKYGSERIRLLFEEQIIRKGVEPEILEPAFRDMKETYRLQHTLGKADNVAGERLAYMTTQDAIGRLEMLRAKEKRYGKMMGAQRKLLLKRDMEALEELVQWRVDTGADVLSKELVPGVTELASGQLTGKMRIGGEELDMTALGPVGGVMAELLFDASMMRRLAKKAGDDFRLPVALQDRMVKNMERASAMVVNTVKEGLGPVGRGILDNLRRTQGEILAGALRAGSVTAGSPIGYLHRVYSDEAIDAMNKVLGKMPEGALRRAGGHVSARKRQVDHMTVWELNDFMNELRKGGDEKYWESFKKIAEADGKPFKPFEEEPVMSLMTRMGQIAEIDTTGDFLNTFLAESTALISQGKLSPIVPGKVIGFVTKGDVPVVIASDAKKFKTLVRKGEKVSVTSLERADKPLIDDIGGFVIQLPDGRVSTMTGQQLGFGRSLVAPGALDNYADIQANTFGHTLSNLIPTGQFDRGHAIIDDWSVLKNRDTLAKMLDTDIMYGDSRAIAGLADGLAVQHKVAGELGIAVDSMHVFMKKFQTVFRPSFHIANVASGIFQSLTAGHGLQNTIGGSLDAARFLHGSPEWASKYSTMTRRIGGGDGLTRKQGLWANLLTGGTSGYANKKLEWLRAVRREGYKPGELSEVAGAAFGRKGFAAQLTEDGADLADHVFKIDGRIYKMSELLDAMVDTSLFGTYISEGLRGATTVPKTLRRLRDSAKRTDPGSGFKDAAWRTYDDLSSTSEVSEVYVRLQNFFSGLRSGLDPHAAAELSGEANVRYHQLTSFEKTWAKRAFTYYTFPRKFFPFAWRKFAEDPSQTSKIASSVIAGIENGIAVDANGKIEVRLPGDLKDWRYDIQRSAANVDALIGLEATLQFLMPGSDMPGKEIMGQAGAPAYLQTGPLVAGAYAAFGPRKLDDPPRVHDIADLIPQIRWAAETLGVPYKKTGRADILTSGLEEAVMAMTPFKKVRPKHEARVYRARMRTMVDHLRREMKAAYAAGDRDLMEELQAEYMTLRNTYQSKLGEVLD